ncbi:diacylglycerol acyltransferase family [Aspergillus nomiae NRRL 13137]|uniref:Diacylglycerol acyltransferase family n=1 Tax=Aspergillus nomiae NRRL (strain ATCC 15546 / NRRL 13137 / CBS 260.88 / M93) TaxID=1509407 RepID=A0A0L1IZG0_ASPN3|nr:diacylglycerol acyltransferase family [Aspergillus nomiae NRRL 13137]KNG84909.1 diacylglycerol acyltransferase family [Aspergillus nomiae NRRL 13137]
MMASNQRTSVLFLANSEHGQTNIILAITHELLVRGDVDVHIGSFPALERRIDKLLADNASAYDGSFRSRIHFHPIRGPSNTDVFIRTGKRGAFHPPGYHGAVLGFQSLCEDIWGWTEDEYVDIYNCCVEIIKTVQPSVIAADFFFLQGRDAAYNTGYTAILINTTSLTHIVLGLQPQSAALWKYPLPGTGFPYPLPWHLVPLNALAVIKTAKMYHGSGRRREIREWRIRHKIHGRFPFADAWRPDRFHLSPALKELDWPMEVPDNILPCGPILLPTAAVHKQDSELASWLRKAPTVLVNLGTLYAPDPKVAESIATGLKLFLDAWKGEEIQILWKLPKHPHDEDDVYSRSIQPLRQETEADRVRIHPWFSVEPMAMLQTGQIICSVHHGGANSWYEAIQNGVPHVVLPAWQDCYENAARAEWLGIGVYGNKTQAPNINGRELSNALLKVMSDCSYKEKALDLAKLCQKKEGRVAGAEKIVELARNPDLMAMDIPDVKIDDTQCQLSEIRNRSGMVLQSVQLSQPAGKPTAKPFLNDLAEAALMTALCNTWFILPLLGYSLLLIPRLRFLVLIYIIYIKYFSKAHQAGTLPLRNDKFRRSWIWKILISYFPLRLYRSASLSPRRKYIFGYHPHGVAIRGAVGAFAADVAGFSQLFPGITNTLLMKDSVFSQPLLREYLLSAGLSGVSRTSCIRHLTRGGHDGRGMGRAITITVGGSREYNVARPGTMGVVIKIRKGFIRVAVETGADIVPVVAFGENDIFDRVDVESKSVLRFAARLWEWCVGHKVAFSIGRFNIFCPYRKPLNVVVGNPIPVTQQRWDPDEKYINQLHQQYMRELERLWESWKDTFGTDKSVKFELVE